VTVTNSCWSGMLCKCSWKKIRRNYRSQTIPLFHFFKCYHYKHFFVNRNDQLWCTIPKTMFNHTRNHLNMHIQEVKCWLKCICVIHSILSSVWNKTTLTEMTTEVFLPCESLDIMFLLEWKMFISYIISEFSFHIFWKMWQRT
jgi:hypothetical protein